TLNLNGVAQTYTGSTTIIAGAPGVTGGSPNKISTLQLSFNTNVATNIISASSALILGGASAQRVGTQLDAAQLANVGNGSGRLLLSGAGAATSQTFASTTLGTGASDIVLTSNGTNALTVNLGAITRSPGGTLFVGNPNNTLSATNSVRTSSGSASSLLTDANGTAYAVLATNSGSTVTDWAMKNAGNVWLTPLVSVDTVAATTNYAKTLTGGSTIAGSTTVTVASSAGLTLGAAISGAGIPAGATIVSAPTATTIVISVAASANNSAQTYTVADNINFVQNNTTGWVTQTINSLRNVATTTSGTTLTLAAGSTLTVATGGILYGSAVGGASTITGGTIVPGLGRELVVFANGRTLTINSVLGESAAGSSDVTFRGNIAVGAGNNDVVLGANNTYSGDTYVSGIRVRNASSTVTSPFGTGVNGNVFIYGNNGGQFLVADNTVLAARNWYIIGNGWEEGTSQPGAFHGAIRLGNNVTLAGTLNLMGDAGIRATGAQATVSAKLFGDFNLTARSGWGDGTIVFTGDNTGWAGSYTIGSGAYRFDSLQNLGSPTSIQLGTYGTIIPNFAGVQAAVLDKIAFGSAGTVALRLATATEPLDFRSANLAGVSLGANENLTYTGAFQPNVVNGQATLRLGGGGANLTYANSITGNTAVVLTGGSANNSYGTVFIQPTVAGSNTYVGGTIVGQNGPFGAFEVANIPNPWAVFGNGPITFVSANPAFRLNSAIPSFATDPLAADMSSATNLTSIVINGGAKFNTNRLANTDMVVFARGIGAYGASGSFVKEGRGILRLDGINTYLGNTDNNGPGAGITSTILLNNANPFNAGYGTNGAASAKLLYFNNAEGNIVQLNRNVTIATISAPVVNGVEPNTNGSILNLNGFDLTIAGTSDSVFAGRIWGGVGAIGTLGSGGLVKLGSGTFSLVSNNNGQYTGKTTVLGGTLYLDYSWLTTAPTTIINSGSTLELGGGTFLMKAKGAGATNTQAFNGLTLLPGGSRTTRNLNTATALNLSLGAITRAVAGSGVDFTASGMGTGGITTTNANDASGILGGWATVDAGAGFATVTGGTLAPYAAYSATYAAGANVDNGTLATIGASPISVNSLRFNAASNVTLDATAGLTVASGGILVTPTVGANSVTITGGTITSGNGQDLIFHQWGPGTSLFAVDSKITGNIGLTKVGTGMMIVRNPANDFTGAINIGGAGGVFRVEASGALGASTNPVNLISTGQFQIDQGVTIANPIYVKYATGISGQGAIFLSASSGSATLSGAIRIEHTTIAGGLFASNGATLDIAGPVTAASGQMVTARVGNIRFSNDPLVSGVPSDYDYFYNQQAYVTLGANNALSTRAIVDIGSVLTATLDLNGYNQTIGALTRIVNADGRIVTNTSAVPSTLTINVAANDGGIFTGDWAYSGQLLGNLAIVKAGPGIQLLGGANFHTGGTTVEAGTLRIGSATALGGDTGFNGALTVNGGVLDVFGTGNAAVGVLAGSGGVITDNGLLAGGSVLSTFASSSSSFAGAINDGAFRSMALYKDGSGVLTLSGNSNYTGVTKVFAGAINASSSAAFGSALGATIVSPGAAVQLSGGLSSAEPFVVQGSGLAAGVGVLQNLSGANVLSGAVTVVAPSRFGSDAGSLTLAGAIDATGFAMSFGGAGDVLVTGPLTLGAASLTKDGLGTLVLGNANTLTGAIAVNAGALRIAHASAVGSASSLAVASGAALQISGGIAYAGVSAVSPVLQNVAGANAWSVGIRPANGGALSLRSDAGVLTLDGPAGTLDAQSPDGVNRALVLTGAGDGVLATTFANAASFAKAGAGIWTVSVPQSYAIETAVNGGTLRAGAAGVFSANSSVRLADVAGATLDLAGTTQSVRSLEGAGANGGAVLLGANGELTVGANGAFGGSVDGSGTSKLIKSGSGVFAMGPTSALTGTVAVNVNAGTFSFGGNAGANVTANVASAAVLRGSGSFLGTVNVANGGVVEAGNGSSGSLAVANLVLGAAAGDLSTLRFRNIDLGASASVMNIGAFSALGGANSVTISAVNGGALANGTYDLANFTTALTDFSVFTVGAISGLGGRQSGTLVTSNANKLSVVIAGDSVRWHGDVDTVWHLPDAIPGNGTLNLRLVPGGAATDYRAADAIVFNDLAVSGAVAISEGAVSPSSLTIDNSALNYAFTGAFGVTGATGIVKNGAGQATFANTGNAFTGGVTVNAGTLVLQSAQNIAGGLTVNGGDLVLSAANTLSGNVALNGAGSLTLGASGALGSGNAVSFGSGATGEFKLAGQNAVVSGLTTHATVGTPRVVNGVAATVATLTVDVASGSQTFAGVLADGSLGTLALAKSGAGTFVLTGANTLTGGAAVSAGVLQVGQGGALGDASVAAGASLAFDRADNFSYAGSTSGLGSVSVLGGGVMTITGAFAHDGGTLVASGQTLTLGTGSSIGGAGSLTVDGSLRVNTTGSASIGTSIGGVGGLSVDAGTLVLTGANTYQGTTVVASGATLQVGAAGASGALPPAAVVTNDGSLVVSRSGSLSFANTVNGGGEFVSRMADGGVLTLAGVNGYTGATKVENGTLVVGSAAAWSGSSTVVLGSAGKSATLELNGFSKTLTSLSTQGVAGDQTVRNSTAGTATLTFAGGGVVSFGGAFAETSATSRIAIGYSGGGVLAFGSTNFYTGGTVVSDGTARLGANNAFSVGSITLGGNGTVGRLDLGGFNQTVTSLTVGAGAVGGNQLIGNSSTTADSVLTYTGGTTTFDLVVQDVLGAGIRKTGLALTGSGTVTLLGANTYSGPTTIAATSTVQVGNFATSGAIGRGTIANDGTLVFARTDAYQMPAGNIVTGNGTVVLGSTGAVTVSAPGQFDTNGALIFGNVVGSTVVSSLDLSAGGARFGSLTVRNRNAVADNLITIGSGQTLQVNGAVTVGFNSAATTETRLRLTGGGSFLIGSVGNSALINVQIGANTTTNVTNRATVDMSGLSSFYAGLAGGTFRVGDPSNANGGAGGGAGSSLVLAPTSTIVAANLVVDAEIDNVTQLLRLGTGVSTLNVNTITVGTNRSDATLNFLDANLGSLVIRNRAGTGRAAVNVGVVSSTTGAVNFFDMDLRGHAVDILASTLSVGGRTGNDGNSTTATFSMDQGVLDVSSVILGDRRNTVGAATGNTTGTLNIGGGTVVVGATGMNIAPNTSTHASSQISTGIVNITGGNVTINGPVVLGSSANTNGTAVAELNITGGTVDVRNSIAKGVGNGFSSVTSTLRLSNATLDLNGFTIGTLTRPINSVLLESGTLRNVTEINGGGALSKTTSGVLILEGINAFSGALTVSAGTLQVGTGLTSGTLGTGAVVNNADLVINRAGTYAVANAISGTGAVTSSGSGTVILSGANSYAGLTSVSAGVLAVANGTALGTVAGGTTVASGASLEFRGGVTVGAEALAVSGTGASGIGAVRNLSGVNAFGGAVTLGGATLFRSEAGTLTLSGALAADTHALSFDGAGNLVVSGALTGTTASVAKAGAGKLTLSGANAFDGAVAVTDGVLSVGSAGALGSTVAGTTVSSGASLEFQGGATVAAEAVTLGGTGFAGSGALRNLSGANALNGTVTLSDATLVVADAGTLTLGGASAIVAGSNALTFGGAGDVVVSGAITGPAATLAKIGAGRVTLSGANDFAGGATVSAGTLALGASDALADLLPVTVSGGVLDVAAFNDTVASVSLVSGSITGSTGVLTSTADYDLRSGTVSAVLGGSANVVKTTAGVLTLSGANTFTGQLRVNQGTVAFTQGAHLGAGSVRVDGGVLAYAGVGTLATPVSASASQNLSVGSSGATLNVANRFATLSLGGTVATVSGPVALTKTGLGRVNVAGSVDLGGGTVTVSQGALGAGFVAGGVTAVNVANGATLNLFDGAAVSLGSALVSLADGSGLGFDLGAPTVSDAITLAAGSTLGATVTINLSNVGGLAAGSYTLLSSITGPDLRNTSWILGSAPVGLNYKFETGLSGGQQLVLNASPIINRYFNAPAGGSWNVAANWSEDLAGLTPASAVPSITDTLIFSTANVTGPAVATTLDAALTVDSLVFTSVPTGVTSVSVAPGTGGTLAIYPGSSNNGIEVQANAGAVLISAPITTQGVQTWTVDGTGANGSSLTLSGGVAFNTPVTKAGAGLLVLTGAGTGSGGLNISLGSVNVGSASAFGTGLVRLGSGVILDNVSGAALANSGGNAFEWNAGFTFVGTQSYDLGAGAVLLRESSGVTVSAGTLTVGGAIGDAGSGFALTKLGTGALVLNGANTFGGAGQTVDVQGGLLTVSSDAGLGHAGNSVTLAVNGATAATGLSVTGSFTTARQINLNAAANSLGVLLGQTLTVSNPFFLSAAGNTLAKHGAGTLVLPSANAGWTGGLTINAGVVSLGNALAAGTGPISIAPGSAARGTALQLVGGFELTNPITLQGTAGQLQGGVNFGGQLQSVSGVNTVSGLITLPYGAVIGADAGSTLRIYGGIQNTVGNNTLMLNAKGDIVLGNTEMSFGGSTRFNSVEKLGAGTLRIESSNVTEVIDQNTNGLLIRQGTVLVDTNGSWRSRVFLDVGSVLRLDNTAVNFSTGRLSTTAGGIYKNITFRGGWLDILGGTMSASATVEGFQDTTFGKGVSMISLKQQSLALQPTNLVFRGAAWGNNAPTQGTAAPGVSMVFRGVGQTPGSGRASVQFINAPALSGETGAAGVRNRGILPWAIVDINYSGAFGSNVSFATLGSVNNNIRWLDAPEYDIDPTVFGGTAQGVVTNSNVLLTAASAANLAVTSNTQRNSLTIEGGAGLALADGVQFSLRSGGILVRPGSVSTLAGGVINQVAASTAGLNVWTLGDLTISSALAGGNGVGNGSPSLIKAGEGTLTIAPPLSAVNGLGALGTNTLSGLFMLNQGTVKLGSLNAILANNYFSAIGGTLDLNGKSQLFFGTFTESTITNQGTTITSSNGAGHLLINADNTGRQFAGRLVGNVSLTRSGLSTLNLWGVNSHTGSTNINGGLTVMYGDAAFTATSELNISYANLYLDNNNSLTASADRINDAAVVNLRQGYIELRGRDQTAVSEALGTVNLLEGNSFLYNLASDNGGGTVTMSIGNLVRAVKGGTVNFSSAGAPHRILLGQLNGAPVTASSVLVNGLIGPWAVSGLNGNGNTHFASYSDTLGVGPLGSAGYAAYSNLVTDATTLVAPAATANINLNTGGVTVPVASDLTINSLRFGDTTSIVVDVNAGRTLTVSSGGILFAGTGTNSHYLGVTDNVGSVTTTAPELVLHSVGGGWQVFRSAIVGSGVTLVKSGNGPVFMAGVNTYDGGTIVNQGWLGVNGNSRIPLAADVTRGLVLNGGQVEAFGAGVIAAGNEVILNANATLRYFGDNTVAKLTINNNGSNGTGWVRTFATNQASGAGSRGVLTIGAGGLVATSSNVTTTSFIEGRVDFGATPNFIDVAPISGGGFADVDPLRPTLAIQAIVGSSGGVTKTGNGVLQFSAQGFFASDFTVAAGGIRTGVTNGGSRLSTLVLNAGTRFDLNNLNTTWGGLAGSGDVFSSLGTPTLSVGFNNADTVFSGRFMRFNDAAYPQFTKIGSGRLTLTGDQPATGSFGAISVGGGILAYAGAGQAFESTLAAQSVFNVNAGGTLLLDNATTNVSQRLGAGLGGRVNIQGGVLSVLGSASGATNENVAFLASQNGGGRIELRPDATQSLSFGATELLAASPTGSLVIAGAGALPGAGVADVSVTTLNFAANQGVGSNGSEFKAVRGDILVDASATGPGAGFLTVDSITGRIRSLDPLTETAALANTMGGIYNARLTTATTLTAPTTVNTLTTSGTASVASGLAASVFGKYGPSGDLLSLTLTNAAGLLVRDGTTTFDMGTMVGPAAGAAYFHVLPGATLNVNAALIPAATGGFVLDNGGTMVLGAITGAFTGTVAINDGTLRLASGLDNTLAISASAGAISLPYVSLNGAGAVLDIGANNQAVRGLSSSNPLPGMGGTVTGLAGAVFSTQDNSTFAGRLTGGLSFVRGGNTTTTLTSASDYAGTTVVRGGTLELRDGGSIASTAGMRLAQGILTLNNFGLNASESPVRIAAANAVTMSGGTLTFIGGGSADNILNLNQVTLERGSNQLNSNPYISMGATNRINLGNLTVASAGVRPVLNFNGWTTLNSGGINTLGGQGLTQNSNVWISQLNGSAFSSASLVNGLIGGWAIADGSTFATYSSTFGVVAMGQQYAIGGSYPAPNFTGTDISAVTLATGNYNDGAAARTITGARVANSWRLSLNANQDYALSNAPITLGVGIVTNNGSTITLQGDSAASSISSASGDLYIYTNQGTMNINARFTGAMNFIKTGGGTLRISTPTTPASNDYVGTTYVSQGTLNLGAAAGFVLIPGDLVITGMASGTNSAVVMQTNEGQITSNANVSLLGGGNLTLVGNNTLRALTFDNEGAMSNPTVAVGASLILSEAAAITATNQSTVSVPVISGTALQFSSANPVITVNAGLAATGLTISAPITQNAAMLSLTKSGTGLLALSGQSTFSSDFTLAQGSLMLGANSTPVSGAITSGPLGRGALQVSAGTSLLSDGTVRTIANLVNVNGDFAFGGRGAGAGVTLTGKVSLGAAARTISVTNYGVTATFNGGLSTDLTDRSTALTKTGNGVLVLGTPSTGADLKGAAVRVSGGVIRWGGNDSLPADTFLIAGTASGFDLAGFNQTTDQISGTGFFTNSSAVNPSTLTVGGDNSSFTFSGALTDNVAGGGAALNLTKVGTGVLSFGAVNNYAGLTDIQAGRLDITNIGSFGLGAVSIATGAELRLDRTGTLNFPNSLSGSGDVRSVGAGTTILTDSNSGFSGRFLVDNGILQVGNGTLIGDSGDFGSALRVVVNTPGQVRFNYSQNYSLYRQIEGTGDLVQQGAQTLVLSTPNPLFAGRAVVNNGRMEANAAGSLRTASGIVVNTGAVFAVTGADAVGNSVTPYGVPLTVNGGVATALDQIAYVGALTLNGGDITADAVARANNSVTTPSWVILGNISATDNSTLSAEALSFGAVAATRDFNVSAGKTLLFSGSVSDDGVNLASVSKSGAGTLELSGLAKTYGGKTTLNGGFLKLGDLAQLGLSDSAVHANLVFAGGSVEYTGVGVFGRKFLVKDGGAGFHATSGANPLLVTSAGLIDFDDAAPASGRALTLSGTSALANTYSAGLLDGGDAARAFSAIVKNGVGQWIVDGAGASLAPDAEVTVNGGVLGFYMNALGGTASNGAITLGNNATLRWESTNNQDLGARLKVADGASATIRFENTTTATTFNDGFNFVSGANTGTGALVKSGSGDLVLAAANTFSGGLTVDAGKVTVNHSGALGSGAANVSGGATLVVNNAVTNAIVVAGAGAGPSGGQLVASASVGAVTVGSGGIIGRGPTIGTLSSTSMTLSGGSRLEFKLWDINTRSAGVGYDQYAFGDLDLSGASVSNKIVIKLISLSDGLNLGAAGNLSLLTGAAGIQTFSFGSFNAGGLNLGANNSANISDLFAFDTSQFTYTGGTASDASLWALNFDTANGAITLTAVPEPSTYGFGLGALALAAAALRRRKRQEKKA
ncbi:MAG: hypothetical protein RLZZ233_1, partial [Verrucomicrobiota bacterium]